MSKTTYICTLPQETQSEILNDMADCYFCNGGNILTDEEKELKIVVCVT